MDYKFYSLEKEKKICWIYLNRVEKKNAMNPPAWTELPQIISELDADEEVSVIIIASKGDVFSAGIDLFEMTTEIQKIMGTSQRGEIKSLLIQKISLLQDTINSLQNTDKPVIAAINGLCIGAGLDLISACDIRICSKDARFSLREVAVGFVPDVGVLQRLPLIVGEGITRELAFTARFFDAEYAKRILLINEIYEDRETLHNAARDMAMQIASNSPRAVKATKKVLNFISEERIRRGLKFVASESADIIQSGDMFEAISAFSKDRKPIFKE